MKKIIRPRLEEDAQKQIDELMDKTEQGEVEVMVYNLEKTLDDIEKKGI